jgi:hypothetical protein
MMRMARPASGDSTRRVPHDIFEPRKIFFSGFRTRLRLKPPRPGSQTPVSGCNLNRPFCVVREPMFMELNQDALRAILQRREAE